MLSELDDCFCVAAGPEREKPSLKEGGEGRLYLLFRLWKVFGSEQFLRGMWEYFILKRAWARVLLADTAQEKQEGILGQWQHGLLQRSFGTSQKKCGHRLQCPNDPSCVHRIEVGQLGKLQRGIHERRKAMWMDCYDKVALEDIGRLSIAQDILRESTDFLRRIIAPVSGTGVTFCDTV